MKIRGRLITVAVLLVVVGTICIVVADPFVSVMVFVGPDGNLLVNLLSVVSWIFIWFGMPFAAGLVCLSVVSAYVDKREHTQVRRHEWASRLLKVGIGIFVVGLIFGSSADILVAFGATTPAQDFLFNITGVVAQVLTTFGMPLAAGFLCLAIAGKYMPLERDPDSKPNNYVDDAATVVER